MLATFQKPQITIQGNMAIWPQTFSKKIIKSSLNQMRCYQNLKINKSYEGSVLKAVLPYAQELSRFSMVIGNVSFLVMVFGK